MPLTSAKSELLPRASALVLLVGISYILWIVLEPYRLRSLASVIPLLFAAQIFVNDGIESFLVNKFYKTWWFKFLIAPGTILHELCHLIAAFASGCSIGSFSLFRINPASGTVGYVNYSNPEDKWHVIRELLVALAPFFGCGIVILAINAYLGGSLLENVGLLAVKFPDDLPGVFSSMLKAIAAYFKEVALKGGFNLILVYLQLCFAIGSAPSSQDLRNTMSSMVRHPLSALFFVLLASLVVLLPEVQISAYGIGSIIQGTITFAFKFIVYVLLLSLSVLLISLPVLAGAAWFTGIKDKAKYAVLLVAAAAFYLTEEFMELENRVVLSAVLFLVLLLVVRNPGFLLKKA